MQGINTSTASRWTIAVIATVTAVLALALSPHPAPATKSAQAADPKDSTGPLDLAAARFAQQGAGIAIKLRVRGAIGLSDLRRKPRIGDNPEHGGTYLCLRLEQNRVSRVCASAKANGKGQLLKAHLSPNDVAGKWRRVEGAKVSVSGKSLIVRSDLKALKLRPGKLRWKVLSRSEVSPCVPVMPKHAKAASKRNQDTCIDSLPDRGSERFKVRKPAVTGCTQDEHLVNYRGAKKGKKVALTFDDGPSDYSERILKILRKEHVHATFFLIGDQVPGREDIARDELADGNELGDHSMHHSQYPSQSDIAQTGRVIEHATGFQPCLFRPPYGAINGSTAQGAYNDGMSSILWDIDTRDWQLPGTSAIISRATQAKAGSIVLMHDGGGNRSQTVAAVPSIIHTLKHRGYKLVTVSELLGEHQIVYP